MFTTLELLMTTANGSRYFCKMCEPVGKKNDSGVTVGCVIVFSTIIIVLSLFLGGFLVTFLVYNTY